MRFDTIVLGVDFTPEALTAARWIRSRYPDADLVLVHACPDPGAARVPGRRFVSDQQLARVVCEGAHERFAEWAGALPQERLSYEVRIGSPVDVIAGVAEERSADLIAIGPHSRHRIFDGLLGSTGEGLMLRADVPVLLVANPGEGSPRTVLAPVDGSSFTRDVLRTAQGVADPIGAALVPLHVHDTAAYAALSVLHAGDGERIRREALTESRLWFAQYAEDAGAPELASRLRISFGEARHEILAMAQQTHADMIVMASHGAGGALYRRVIGSVAAWVLRHARCTVMVVKRVKRDAITGVHAEQADDRVAERLHV